MSPSEQIRAGISMAAKRLREQVHRAIAMALSELPSMYAIRNSRGSPKRKRLNLVSPLADELKNRIDQWTKEKERELVEALGLELLGLAEQIAQADGPLAAKSSGENGLVPVSDQAPGANGH